MTKVAVITGASAGVGRATARRFAAHGYDLGLLARGEDGLHAAVEEAISQGVRAVAIRTDVANLAAVEDAADRTEAALGPIDVWVNNAMVSVFAPFLEMTDDEFRRVIDVTFLGAVHGTRAALRRMTPRNHGTIVQVGSGLAYRGIPLQSAYCAAKHALQGLNDSVRSELFHAHSDVHVCMVQLPALNTPQFEIQRNKMPNKAQPVPPIFQPEVAAKAILYAAEHRRRELWVTWPTARAILGQRIIPGALDRYLGRVGYRAQQTNEPNDPKRPDALFEPVPGDHGAHGAFDTRSRIRSRLLDVALSPYIGRAIELFARALDRSAATVLVRLLGPQADHSSTTRAGSVLPRSRQTAP